MGAKTIAAVLTAVLLVTGCTRIERSHGYVPTDRELSNIEVGRDTRETVSVIIGRPSLSSLRSVDGWYYVRSDYETFLFREPEEVNREIVAILYSDAGTVANIERFGLEEGRLIALSRRVTDTNVSGIGFLRQLLGNVGNFRLQDFVEGE